MSQDYMTASMWYNISTASGGPDKNRALEELSKRMTPEELSQAQQISREDASLEQMEAKTHEFRRAAEGAKAAWFHYSGHGTEVKGVNYLIPVDADVKNEFQVKHQAFAIDQMLGALEEAGAPLKVVVLDYCRNNPFGRGWSRSGSVGLAQISDTPSGTIIAFATSPGKEAADGCVGW